MEAFYCLLAPYDRSSAEAYEGEGQNEHRSFSPGGMVFPT